MHLELARYGSASEYVLAIAIRSSSKQETLTGIPNHMSLLLSIPSYIYVRR